MNVNSSGGRFKLAMVALVIPVAGCPERRAAPRDPAPSATGERAEARRAPASPRKALPPNPRRKTAPAGIETRALRSGQVAPDFTLPSAAAKRWSLNEHLAGGPVVLVFYRGHW